jgi:hypothetical protein
MPVVPIVIDFALSTLIVPAATTDPSSAPLT